MEINEYKEELLKREGLPITKDLVLFTDFELYNQETDESIMFKSFEDVLEYKVGDKKIEDIIKEKEDIFQDEGGRGAGSRVVTKGGRLFGGKGARSGGNGNPPEREDECYTTRCY